MPDSIFNTINVQPQAQLRNKPYLHFIDINFKHCYIVTVKITLRAFPK